MDETTPVEQLFELVDDLTKTIQQELSITYLEAIAEAGEDIFQGTVVQRISAEEKDRLEQSLDEKMPEAMEQEDIRKAFQLALIKGMKQSVQQHHAITPDAVAIFMGYLVDKLMNGRKEFVVADPAVGTGNLLSAVLNQLSEKNIEAYGSEVDETLIKIAYTLSNLQEHAVQLFHQDSIEQFGAPGPDVVMSDLPVGYYPKNQIAELYQLGSTDGKSYVHHLLVEGMMNRLKPGGFMVLLIPNNLFEDEKAAELQAYVKKHAHTLGLLQLPETMFQAKEASKSIWMLQKKSPDVRQPGQALLAELPSFSRQEALQDMMKRINDWFVQEGFINK